MKNSNIDLAINIDSCRYKNSIDGNTVLKSLSLADLRQKKLNLKNAQEKFEQ